MVQPLWKTVWRFLKNLKIELPRTQQLHSWVFTPKTHVVKRRAICTPVFIAAMSAIAKLWKEPRCPSKDEWITMCFRGRARWRRNKRPGFRLVPGIQLDRDQTIMNIYELNRRSKKGIAATL